MVLTTAPREWQGNGVLRVMPRHQPFQVLHFWDDDGAFAGRYVNFESPRRRRGDRVVRSTGMDLWIDPDGTPSWKDEDEAEAAMSLGHLDPGDLATARATGLTIIADLPGWLHALGDWRGWVAPPGWHEPLRLPDDWDA